MERECEGCGTKTKKGNKVESVFHKHNNASGLCRKVKVICHFKYVCGTGEPNLCYNCQRKVISGMASGGNWG